jgi:hypothetical protein
MGRRGRVARGLVGAGVVLLLGGAATHWLLAYPRLPAALEASGLKAPLPAALEAVFLLAGWDWVVLAAVALLAISRKSVDWRGTPRGSAARPAYARAAGDPGAPQPAGAASRRLPGAGRPSEFRGLLAPSWPAVPTARPPRAVRKPLLLLCGAAVVAEAGLMLAFLGWFLGTDIIAAAGALLLAGGVVVEGDAAAVGERSAAG